MSVDIPKESNASIVASNEAEICSLLVCAEALNAAVLATYSVLNAEAADDDKAVSPALYSVLNADALEDEKAVCVAVGNLLPIVEAIEADKLASSPNAAASSSKVSKAPGAALTKAFTLAFV